MAANVARDGSGGRASNSRSRTRGGSFGAPKTPAPRTQTRGGTFGKTPAPRTQTRGGTFGTAPKPAPKPAVPKSGTGIRQANPLGGGTRPTGQRAQVTSRPAPQQRIGGQQGVNSFGSFSGAGGDGGFGGGMEDMSLATAMDQPVEPPKPTEDEYLAADGTFTSQKGALKAILDSLNADLTGQEGDYQTTYDKNLKDLGWLGAENGTNRWNRDDVLTGYGSAFRGNQNDFAARGLYDSSGYADSLVNLDRGFNDQVANMGTARQTFLNDTKRQREAGQSEHDANVQRARADALARYAMEYGL